VKVPTCEGPNCTSCINTWHSLMLEYLIIYCEYVTVLGCTMLGLSGHHTQVYHKNPAFIVDLCNFFQEFFKLYSYCYKGLLRQLDKSIFLI